MSTIEERDTRLPIRSDLTLPYMLSSAVGFLVATAAVAGIIFRTVVYPSDELLRTFVSNDVVSLLVGLPLLLGSMLLAWRGRLIGLLSWPGALLFVLYNYIAYVIAMPLGAAFPLHVTLVMLSAYTLIALVARIDGKAVQGSLAGVVPERAVGGVLAVLGFLFLLRSIGVAANLLVSGTAIAVTDLAVNISDLMISPAWVVGGILLWRRKQLGYVMGLGLLLGISLLFVALIILLLLQPVLTTAPFVLGDVAMIAAMSLVCLVPLYIFVRGVVSRDG